MCVNVHTSQIQSGRQQEERMSWFVSICRVSPCRPKKPRPAQTLTTHSLRTHVGMHLSWTTLGSEIFLPCSCLLQQLFPPTCARQATHRVDLRRPVCCVVQLVFTRSAEVARISADFVLMRARQLSKGQWFNVEDHMSFPKCITTFPTRTIRHAFRRIWLCLLSMRFIWDSRF
jgi:hypothetical protein